MDKIILAVTETILQPFIDDIRKKYEKALRDETHRKGGIPKPESVIQQEVEFGCEELKKFLIGEEEINRMEKGFELVLRELDHLPNKEEVLEDFKNAGDRLLNESDDTEEFELPIHDTVQEMFGLSDETFETMYQISSRLYNTGKWEEALDVLVLLTTLNTFVFEPWLGLGSCWLRAKKFPEALQAFTMASLLNFHHPAPHIFAAECYLGVNNTHLARETLELALSLMDMDQKTGFQSHIEFIQKQLNNR